MDTRRFYCFFYHPSSEDDIVDLEEGRTEVLGKVWLPAITLREQER